MVDFTTNSKEYVILQRANNLVQRFAGQSLVNYSIQELIKHKLVTRNFKNGLNFNDSSHSTRYAFKKLVAVIKNRIYTTFPFLLVNAGSYIDDPQADNFFRIKLINEDSVHRYLRLLRSKVLLGGLPVNIRTVPELDSSLLRIDITLYNSDHGHDRSSRADAYKILNYMPEVIQALSTLSRKARYYDETFRSVNKRRRVVKQAA